VAGIVLITLPLWWNWSKKNMHNYTPLVLFGRKMHPFFSLSYRDIIYKFAWQNLYSKYANKWFGIGNGTFYYAMPAIQILEKEELFMKTKQVVTWLHSSLFQWAIEGGKLGLILLIFASGELILIGHNDPFFMGFMACLFFNSCFNFPDKMPADSFLSIMVIKKLVFL
jgi:O-antigen ligase